MSHLPPIQFDMPTVEHAEPTPGLPRVWLGWVLLTFIFGMLIYGSFLGSEGKSLVSPEKERASQTKMLEALLSTKAFQGNSKSGPKMFEAQLDEMVKEAKTSHEVQRLRVALRAEDRDAPFDDDLKHLAESKSTEDQSFAKLYSTKEIKKGEAEPLIAGLKAKDLGTKLAVVQFKEKFGDKEIRAKTFPPEAAIRLGFFAIIALGVFTIGVIALGFYTTQRMAGKLTPAGIPMDRVEPWVADRLAIAASTLILSYLLVGFVSAKFLKGIPVIGEILPYAAIFATIFALTRAPVMGYQLSLRLLGVSKERLGERIGWGVAGSFCMVPILAVVMIFTLGLTKLLPGGSHPIGEELLNNTGPFQVLGMLFLASVVAPIWEEIMFRGLLFPALASVTKNRFTGAALSSLMFAAIHPQGPAGVPVLWTIAMGLCYISYQTKSLIPNMIMHAINNAGALFMLLLIGKTLL